LILTSITAKSGPITLSNSQHCAGLGLSFIISPSLYRPALFTDRQHYCQRD